MTLHYVGFDIAQASDYSAISVIERALVTPYYRLRYLERLPRRTPYPDQCKQVVDLCDLIGRKYHSLPLLACDFTGVGAPVYDILRTSYQGQTKGVTITGGSTVTITDDGKIHRIPKRDLISRLRVALESGHLKISKAMPEAETFVDELSNFELKVDESGHVTMQAAGSGHDDLVMSVSLAVWFAHGRGSFSDECFITPIISKDGRPVDLHRSIPSWMARKPHKIPRL
jgi:hypothetical protein